MQIRNEYNKLGVENFYKKNASTYENPHEPIIHSHLERCIRNGYISNDSVLDLCCGTGQVTSFLKQRGFRNVEGVDPFTNIEYQNRTGCKAYNFDFKKIAVNGLPKKYKTIICSFALHLCPESLLPQVLWQLGEACEKLIIISPNKKPVIGYPFSVENEFKEQRVFTKIYKK